jgi:hypothetical protein
MRIFTHSQNVEFKVLRKLLGRIVKLASEAIWKAGEAAYTTNHDQICGVWHELT